MVDGDGVDDLGQHAALEASGLRLDQPDPELNVSEQAPFLGRREGRAPPELQRPARVVEDRGCDEQIPAKPRVHLRRLAAERRDATVCSRSPPA